MKKKIFLIIALIVCLCGCKSYSSFQQDIDDIISNYNEGVISYDSANYSLIEAENDADSQEKIDYINGSKDLLDKLKESKDCFDQAKSNMDNKEYPKAVENLDNVISQDINYEKAITFRQEVIAAWIGSIEEQAAKYISEDKYVNAIQLYEDANEYIEDSTLSNKVEEIKDKFKQNVETRVVEFVSKKQYEEALMLYRELNDCVQEEAYEVKIEGLENEYADVSIKEAEDMMQNGSFSEAEDMIDTVLECVKTKEIRASLVNEKERIRSFIPVKLTEIKEFYRECDTDNLSIEEWTLSDSDNLGNGGKTGLKFCNAGSVNVYATVAYLLDGKYDRLTGIFALHEDFKDTTDGTKYGAQLLVYCDEELVYVSESIYGGVKPIEIDIDISGTDELRISVYSGAPISLWLSDMIAVGLIEPTLSKDYKSMSAEANNITDSTEMSQ